MRKEEIDRCIIPHQNFHNIMYIVCKLKIWSQDQQDRIQDYEIHSRIFFIQKSIIVIEA